MKSMSNENGSSSSQNNNNNNWLGFSLSGPCMEDSAAPQQAQPCPVPDAASSALSIAFSSGVTYPGIYYGVEGDNADLYSHLTVMPLKSDGSLCLMEAINRSQQPQGLIPY